MDPKLPISIQVSVESWPDLNLVLDEHLSYLLWILLVSMIVFFALMSTLCTMMIVTIAKGHFYALLNRNTEN